MLREAARARGFRLVKSRRRKPGGDFGRFGLVGLESGRECLGFGPDGLTATPEEVHAYLRGGEVAAWKRSLIGVVKTPSPETTVSKGRAARPERSGGASESKEERATPSPSAKPRRGVTRPRTAQPDSPPTVAGGPGGGSSSSSKARAEAALTIREATRRDAAALAKLLGLPAATLAERLAALREDPPLVAEADSLVGIVAWAILPTLQHGTRGRITLLHVADPDRRKGLGAKLLAEAEQRLADAGVADVEMLLDIDIDAPTAFLRSTGWQRSTNGYRKALG